MENGLAAVKIFVIMIEPLTQTEFGKNGKRRDNGGCLIAILLKHLRQRQFVVIQKIGAVIPDIMGHRVSAGKKRTVSRQGQRYRGITLPEDDAAAAELVDIGGKLGFPAVEA